MRIISGEDGEKYVHVDDAQDFVMDQGDLVFADAGDAVEWLRNNTSYQCYDRYSSGDDGEMADYLRGEGWYVFDSESELTEYVEEHDLVASADGPTPVRMDDSEFFLERTASGISLRETESSRDTPWHVLTITREGVRPAGGYKGPIAHHANGDGAKWLGPDVAPAGVKVGDVTLTLSQHGSDAARLVEHSGSGARWYVAYIRPDGIQPCRSYFGDIDHTPEGQVVFHGEGDVSADALAKLLDELSCTLTPTGPASWMANGQGLTAFGSTPLEAVERLQVKGAAVT